MADIACRSDNSCPFLYSCHEKTFTCHHDPVFPITTYPLIVYCLFPFASAICNLSGNSFGEYKVLLIMDMLNYSESAATTLTYPLTVGTALFNFFILIFKRHPNKDTSLVDYNIVMVLIPNILYGSTIGALVNKFIPPIVADSLCIPLLTAFSIKFFLRFWNFRKEAAAKMKEQDQNSPAKELQLSKIPFEEKTDREEINEDLLRVSSVKSEHPSAGKKQNQNQNKNGVRSSNSSADNQYHMDPVPKQERVSIFIPPVNPYQDQLIAQLKYESTLHLPHIFATLLIFSIFQTLAFLAQGKIIFFTICTSKYAIGVSCLTVAYFIFNFGMFQYTKKKMLFYRRIQYDYQVNLDQVKSYLIICAGGFLGGFNGGVFGLGNSTTIIFTLLFLNLDSQVVSATVGFQVVFAGMANLGQAFATDSITLQVAGFFFAVTFVIGGTFSYILRLMVRNFNQNKINQTLMMIVCVLTGSSVIALIANIAIDYSTFGSQYMISIPLNCN